MNLYAVWKGSVYLTLSHLKDDDYYNLGYIINNTGWYPETIELSNMISYIRVYNENNTYQDYTSFTNIPINPGSRVELFPRSIYEQWNIIKIEEVPYGRNETKYELKLVERSSGYLNTRLNINIPANASGNYTCKLCVLVNTLHNGEVSDTGTGVLLGDWTYFFTYDR